MGRGEEDEVKEQIEAVSGVPIDLLDNMSSNQS